MARPSNSFESLTMTIAVTPQIKAYLEDLTTWGTYGASPAEAARTILSKGIEDLLASRLPRRQFKIDEGKVLKQESEDGTWVPIK
jgi:hypothetical protein